MASFITPEIAPIIGAAAVTSVAFLVSRSLPNQSQRPLFLLGFFGLTLSLSYSFILSQNSSVDILKSIWNQFSGLSTEIRFSFALLIFSLSFFAGGFYLEPAKVETTAASAAAALDAANVAIVDYKSDFKVPEVQEENDTKFFVASLEKFSKEIVADMKEYYEMPPEALAWVERMINYNVAGGKMNRGLAVLDVQKQLLAVRGQTPSPKQRIQAAALGWCIEFLQAFFLVSDDVMDGSITRRGNPCWYRNDDVKLIAINDAFILESCVYKILKKYFGSESYYVQLVDLFIEVTRQTEFGQLLDLTSQRLDGVIDLDRFTMERYIGIVRYKTAFYSFYLPVALAMIMEGVKSRETFEKAREILVIMGEYFQVQDDYLDCYGTPEIIGKIGTDIQDNKCCWLVVTALQNATPAQRKVLEENYGKHDPVAIQRIKDLYLEMKIADAYHAYEEKVYVELKDLISKVNDLPHEVFNFLLKKIYKRSK